MHVVIINGSPRAKKYSNTDKIIRSFTDGLKFNGSTYELYTISRRSEWDAAREAYYNNENILIALPLFVENIPGLLMEFLETLKPKDENTKLSFILQSGFAEGIQLRCGESYLEKLAGCLGCSYGGTLVKGDNFSIRFTEGEDRNNITDPYRQMGVLFDKTGDFFSGECKSFTGPETFILPIRVILSLIFKTGARKRFENVAKSLGCSEPLDYRPYEENELSMEALIA